MTTDRYTLIQRILHWTIALAVIGSLIGGQLIGWLENGPLKTQIYFLHKSTGILILGLMLLRVLTRLKFGAPALPVEVPGWQRKVSGATHFLFYALLVIMPLIGWAATSAYPAPLPFFGLFEVPSLIGENRALSEQLYEIHEIMGKVIFALIVLHIGAALHHTFIKKDGVLRRML